MTHSGIRHIINEFSFLYSKKGFINHEDYTLTLYLLCIYKEFIYESPGYPSTQVDRAVYTAKLLKDNTKQRFPENTNKDYLLELRDSFGVINFFRQQEVAELLMMFDALPIEEFHDFPNLFERAFRFVTTSYSFKNGDFIIHPNQIHLLLEAAEVNKLSTVFNPFAGNAALPVVLNSDIHYYLGQEYNPKIRRIGLIRLYAHNKNRFNFEFTQENSLKEWPARLKYDLVFSRLPLLSKMFAEDESGKSISLEEYIIIHTLNSVNEEGKAILIFPYQTFWSGSFSSRLKAKLEEKGQIEKVLNFPGSAYRNSRIESTALIWSRKKSSSPYTVYDMTPFLKPFERQGIADWNILDIKSNPSLKDRLKGYLNSGTEYPKYKDENELNLEKTKEEEEYLSEDNLGFVYEDEDALYSQIAVESDWKNLGELIRIHEVEIKGNDSNFKTIHPYNLTNTPILGKLHFEETGENDESTMNFDPAVGHVASGRGILIFLNSEGLRPTLLEDSKTYYIDPKVCFLRIKNDSLISEEYLILALSSDEIKKQLKSIKHDVLQEVIQTEELLQLKIPVPTIEEQAREVFSFLTDYIRNLETSFKKNEEIKLREKEQLKKEALSLVRHKITGPVSNLIFYADNIREILEKFLEPRYPQIWDLKKNENQILDLGGHLKHMREDSEKIVAEVKSRTEEFNPENYELSNIAILEWLKVYWNGKKNLQHEDILINVEYGSSEYSDSETPQIIEANTQLMEMMFDNMLENIIRHAFQGAGIYKKITVRFQPADTLNPMLTISVSNTGQPLPDDFSLSDFTLRGVKKGNYSGDGMGGFIIGEIVNYLGGKLNVIDETGPQGLPDSDLVTTFSVSLPLTQA